MRRRHWSDIRAESAPGFEGAGTTPLRGHVGITAFPTNRPVVAARGARVLVAATDRLTRLAIRRALEQEDFSVCAEATDAATAVRAALRERPDACLVDAELEGDAGGAIRAITVEVPDAALVLLTSGGGDRVVFDALCAGATGSIPRDAEPARLAHTLQVVLEGDVPLPRSVVAALIEESRAPARDELAPQGRSPGGGELTKREREVLELLREGRTTAEIAARLFISKVTVRSHICAVVRKLGVSDRQAAIRRLADRTSFRRDTEDA